MFETSSSRCFSESTGFRIPHKFFSSQKHITFFLFVLCLSCTQQWDLAKPIFVEDRIDNHMSAEKHVMAVAATRHAVEAVGGKITTELLEQRVLLTNTDDDTCSTIAPDGSRTLAYTHCYDSSIHFCTLVWNTWVISQSEADTIALHELIHVVSGRGDHMLPGTHAVMTLNTADRCNFWLTFCAEKPLPIDVAYLCSGGNVQGGVCAKPPSEP